VATNRFRSFALSLLVAAGSAVIFAAPHEQRDALAASDRFAADAVRSDRTPFRLGDAAAPFSWSTVVGDFNADGRADVAVADHLGTRSGAYAYRLEFSISGQERHDVTFESSRDAITIRLADVDRDNDLDVIVGTPLSGEIVGIWLNDGHGHFTAGDVRQIPAALGPLESLGTTDPAASVATSEWSPRRSDEALPASFGAPPGRSPNRATARQSPVVRSRLPSAQTRPRAPPSVCLSALS